MTYDPHPAVRDGHRPQASRAYQHLCILCSAPVSNHLPWWRRIKVRLGLEP